MRIGIIAPEFPPDIGGVETYAYEFTRELSRRGHDVTVFTQRHDEGEVTLPGVRVLPALRLRRRLDRHILREYDMDVWHVMNAAYAWLAIETTPVIVSVHGNDFLRPYHLIARIDLCRFWWFWRMAKELEWLDKLLGRFLTRRLIRKSLPYARHVIANSKYTEGVFLKHYPSCQGKTSIGMVGVAEDYFRVERVSAAPDEPARFITICRLSEPRKNVDRVLCALANLREKYKFTYTVVGDGTLRPTLETLVQRLALADCVRFRGFVAKEQIKKLLASSHLFILTSSILRTSHEGFGIVYIEANACGTPVLAARLAGAAEAVKEGASGMFVEKATVGQITTVLERFLSGRAQFDSEACRVFARQFSWGKVVDHALSYY